MAIGLNNIEDVFKAPKSSVETMELKGYTLIEEFFVDNSGFGAPNEPAWTAPGFLDKVEEIVKIHGPVVPTITNSGQFQVYVGLFQKTGHKTAKKIGNNTYQVETDNGYAIRLHDTNILIFESDHVTLNSGGWQTSTTKSRMNQYLPSGVSISQKNYEWFVNDTRDNTVKPFTDG